eukprot:439961-Pyramimonas_sp.AAC.1
MAACTTGQCGVARAHWPSCKAGGHQSFRHSELWQGRFKPSIATALNRQSNSVSPNPFPILLLSPP